jgi:pimeloyl-ACP methyl ester carboxylesterase
MLLSGVLSCCSASMGIRQVCAPRHRGRRLRRGASGFVLTVPLSRRLAGTQKRLLGIELLACLPLLHATRINPTTLPTVPAVHRVFKCLVPSQRRRRIAQPAVLGREIGNLRAEQCSPDSWRAPCAARRSRMTCAAPRWDGARALVRLRGNMAAEGEATLAFCSSPPVRHSGLRSNVVPPRVSHVGRRLRAAHRARPSLRPRAVAAEPKTGTPAAVQRTFETFTWRGYSINYRDLGQRDAPPLLLVHGFGASVMHWRKNVDVLAAAGFRVFAIDLLGFGASSKPNLGKGKYRLELWRDLVVDFIRAIDAAAAVSRPWKLCGNSIGSLVSMMAAIELGADRVDGLSLLNCAGGLTSFRLSELNPVAAFLFVCFNTLLFNRFTGPAFFDRFSTRENVRSVLDQAYAGGRDAVSDRLVRCKQVVRWTGGGCMGPGRPRLPTRRSSPLGMSAGDYFGPARRGRGSCTGVPRLPERAPRANARGLALLPSLVPCPRMLGRGASNMALRTPTGA